MGYSYGEWKDKDGNVAVLQSDPISKGRYERKGLEYVGPAKQIPGLEPANEDWQRSKGARSAGKNLNAEEVVRQATDVVVRKIAGTWTEAEAVAERGVIRGAMEEHGSFDWYKANLPSEDDTEAAPPPPYPLEGPPPGAEVSMTGDGATGAPGAPTDGARTPRATTRTPASSGDKA